MSPEEQGSEERCLIARVCRGEPAAFEPLVERYYQRIARLAHHVVGHPLVAEDIAQETFLRAYRTLPRFRGDASFYSWLYRITINLCLNYLRRQPRLSSVEATAAHFLPTMPSDPSTLLEDRERQRLIRGAIDSLPAHYRIVVILRDLEELSYQDIADVLAIPVGTVKSRINFAKRLLKEKLRTLLEET
jgi:RNA polymerase sigma-70 factor, ECF subfamily